MQLITAFTEPNKLFDELKQKPNFALPLLLMMVGIVVLWFFYYSRVDGSWMIEQMASTAGSPAKQKAMRDVMSIGMIKWPTLIGGPIAIAVIYLISAVYYKLAGKVCGVEQSFKAWFSFTAWVSMPGVLSILVALIQVFLMSAQTMPGDISLTHLDPLFVSLPLDHPWKGFLSGFDLLHLWVLALAAIGWKNWSKSSWGQAITVSILPSLVIYGIWALIIVFKH